MVQQPVVENTTLSPISNKIFIPGSHGETLNIGAYKSKSSAFEICKWIGNFTGKPAMVIYGTDYYYVRIPDIVNRRLVQKLASKLEKAGVETYFIPGIRDKTSIQIGPYEKEEEAYKAQKKLMDHTNRTVTVIYENDLYRLLVTGFASKEAATIFTKEIEIK